MRVDVHLTFRPDAPDDQQRFVATVDDVAGEPAVELELEQADGQLTPTAVTVRKSDGVTSRDVRVPVDRYVELVAKHPALRVQGAPAERPGRRRALSDDFLRDVADAYVKGRRSVAAVKAEERFAASDSQVYRWLKAARERGLLDGEG